MLDFLKIKCNLNNTTLFCDNFRKMLDKRMLRGRDETFFCEENYWADSKLTDLGEACGKHHVLFLHRNQGEPCLMEMALQALDTV